MHIRGEIGAKVIDPDLFGHFDPRKLIVSSKLEIVVGARDYFAGLDPGQRRQSKPDDQNAAVCEEFTKRNPRTNPAKSQRQRNNSRSNADYEAAIRKREQS